MWEMKQKNHSFGSEEYFNTLYTNSKEPWGISFRASQQHRYKRHIHILKQFHNVYASILDIGCSQGQFTILLQDVSSNITAIDISEIAIQRAIEKYGICKTIKFESGSLPWLKYDNEQFDLVLALEILHYLKKEDRTKALKEIKRVMVNKGFFIISNNIGKSSDFKIDEVYNTINDFFKIKKIEYDYGRIYSFFEGKLLLLESTKLQKIIRYLLSIEILVKIGQRLTRLIIGRKGITKMCIIAQKSESQKDKNEST